MPDFNFCPHCGCSLTLGAPYQEPWPHNPWQWPGVRGIQGPITWEANGTVARDQMNAMFGKQNQDECDPSPDSVPYGMAKCHGPNTTGGEVPGPSPYGQFPPKDDDDSTG